MQTYQIFYHCDLWPKGIWMSLGTLPAIALQREMFSKGALAGQVVEGKLSARLYVACIRAAAIVEPEATRIHP